MTPLDSGARVWAGLAVAPSSGLMFIVGVLLAGALVGEFIAATTRLPRVVGYTLAGCAAAAFGHGVGMPLAGAAQTVTDLALGLLLFEIGCRVHLRWLARNPGLAATSLAEALLSAVAVAFVMRLFEVGWQTAVACAILAMPAPAAVAGRVALELGAEGQVTQRALLLTALNTLYAVIALTLMRTWWAADDGGSLTQALAGLSISLLTTLGLSALLAGAVYLAARRLDLRNESAALLLFGLVAFALVAARAIGVSTLLMPLLAGLLLRNTSERPWVWPRHFGTSGGALVLMLFVIVGSAWTPQILFAGGFAALALLATRFLVKAAAIIALAPWAKVSWRQGLALSITMTPLSATALVMLSELMRAEPDLARGAVPIILTSIAVLELFGPIAVQFALRLAGELPPPPQRKPRKEAAP
ncbi:MULTISPECIES: cation:proton antiporter [Roseateles]|uniref:Cation:proton antiporter n=1 Tax=Pelomonas caseinilytica TaxID=2906763 RepID=A0ABS8XP58_9BURK|nr:MULTISPECIES: cation:proton antiporter [unclassified Roseateles]MCE4540448.1 cation:proton antiporter [Pelomonas sp. P7]HEV6967809.1 cation:proton antiporter [Roseateles sp.]